MSHGARRTWVSIAIAAIIIAVVVVAGFAGGAYVFVRTHVRTEPASRDRALAEFAERRAAFAGQTPLIEVAADEQPILHRPPPGPRHDLKFLHALVYDPDKGTLSRMEMPGWFVKAMSAGGRIRLANLGFAGDGDERQRLTLEDLERRGPGPVLDIGRRGRRVLVWTE